MSKTVGDGYEERALRFLRARRMTLVARNVRCRGGEVDLVMRDAAGVLVFVEGRAREAARFGSAAETVGPAKQARLRQAARHYLAGLRGAPPPCRFDVVAFDAARVEWIAGAFDDDPNG